MEYKLYRYIVLCATRVPRGPPIGLNCPVYFIEAKNGKIVRKIIIVSEVEDMDNYHYCFILGIE